jgi:hypothetical protein
MNIFNTYQGSRHLLHSFGWHKQFNPAPQLPLGFSHPLQNSGTWLGILTDTLNREGIEEFEVKKGGWVVILPQYFLWFWWCIEEHSMRLNKSKIWRRWSFLSSFMFIPFFLMSMQNSLLNCLNVIVFLFGWY